MTVFRWKMTILVECVQRHWQKSCNFKQEPLLVPAEGSVRRSIVSKLKNRKNKFISVTDFSRSLWKNLWHFLGKLHDTSIIRTSFDTTLIHFSFRSPGWCKSSSIFSSRVELCRILVFHKTLFQWSWAAVFQGNVYFWRNSSLHRGNGVTSLAMVLRSGCASDWKIFRHLESWTSNNKLWCGKDSYCWDSLPSIVVLSGLSLWNAWP